MQMRLMGPIGAATRNPMISPGMTKRTELIRGAYGKGCSCRDIDHEPPAHLAGHDDIGGLAKVVKTDVSNHRVELLTIKIARKALPGLLSPWHVHMDRLDPEQ